MRAIGLVSRLQPHDTNGRGKVAVRAREEGGQVHMRISALYAHASTCVCPHSASDHQQGVAAEIPADTYVCKYGRRLFY